MSTEILILDDSPFLAAHLARQLATLGLQARTVSTPEELCAQAGSAALVFVELQLFQGQNGFQVTRALAAQCACPLILLTGTGRATDLHWGLRAGASLALARPVTTSALRAALQQLGICAGLAEARA